MITRHQQLKQVKELLSWNPVVAILGARQVGKTALSQALVQLRGGETTRFDLESAKDIARLADPELALSRLRGLVVLDEIQRRPELFPTLRVLADRAGTPAKFLVLGSASPLLLQQSSESLAGRIAYHELSGFTLDETGADSLARLWLRGGFPRSFLAASQAKSYRWRREFIRDFLQRDLPQLGLMIPAATLERFWTMLAHYHGQIWNASEFARSFAVSHHVTRRYLDALDATFMLRILKPWNANIKKRQVKSPKVYVRDSGLLHALLGLPAMHDLERHPKIGASWEGFLIEAVIHQLQAPADRCFFWATPTGAELDLLVVHGTRRYGFEFKRTVAPSVTRSMHASMKHLSLERLDVVHAGDDTFPLAENIRALSANRLLLDLASL